MSVPDLGKISENFSAFSSAILEKVRIGEKSLREWQKLFFSFNIPANVTPLQCRKLSTEIMRLNQTASAYYAEAHLKASIAEHSYNSSYRSGYSQLGHQYQENGGKLPSAATLETMTQALLGDEKNIAIIAVVEQDFWRDIINFLTRKRKQLENITMNNALMNKIEGYTLTEEDNEQEPEEETQSIWDT